MSWYISILYCASTHKGHRQFKFFLVEDEDLHIDELVQERRNFIANALELHLSGTNPSIYHIVNIKAADELVMQKHQQPLYSLGIFWPPHLKFIS